MTTSLPGQFEHYTQVTWLGEGGFGAVYRAYDGSLERWVALKTPHQELLRDAGFVEQFKREARLAAQLDHPNIVRVYRIGEVQGAPYIDMELVEGKTLADLLAAKGRYSAAEALALIEPVCQALHAAHDKGILHRDVKPQNILVRASDGRVLVSDFGLAKAQERSFQAALSSANVVVGTFRYMPPEQMDETLGAPGPASDVYSLGVVLYELLTGRPPFEQSSVGQLVHAHTSRAPEPPSNYNISLTPAVESVGLKALQKRPGERFPTALALSQALRAAVERGVVVPGVLPEPSAPAAKAAAPTRSRWILWGALAGLLVVAVLAVTLIPQLLARSTPGATATVDATAWALAIENAVLSTRVALASDPAATAAPDSSDAAPTEMIDPELATAVAATLTAQAPTATASATPTPTPDEDATATAYAALLQAAADATRTALPPTATAETVDAPTPDATATEQALLRQVEAGVAAMLTAQAPTATHTPTVTPTPDADATQAAYTLLLQAALEATRAALPPVAAPANAQLPTPDATATTQALLRQVESGVAATLTAQAPTATRTPTVTPTPDADATVASYAALLQVAVEATRTALPPTSTPATNRPATPNATATERALLRQVESAVAATLTAQAPTATRTPTATPTPNMTATAVAAATQLQRRVAATLTAQAPTATPSPTPNATATAAMVAALPTLQARGVDPAQVRVHPLDGAIYVYVPGGEFLMGSNPAVDAQAHANEQPQRTVRVNGFWIMQTEVTNAQYARCVDAGVCMSPYGLLWDNPTRANHPVVGVNWNQAVAYSQWVGGRLPTEAEWEKACRSTDGQIYPWGDAAPDASLLNFDLAVDGTQPVASYPTGVSGYSVFDMAGNVREWTSDWYDGTYYTWGITDNPAGPAEGDYRVLRGGSWVSSAASVRCASRSWFNPGSRLDFHGFRVVSPGF